MKDRVTTDTWTNDQTGKVTHLVLVDITGDGDMVEFTCDSEIHALGLAQMMRKCKDVFPR